MRTPSARCFPNTVTIYKFNGDQDPDAGVAPNPYDATPIASNVACSVQPDEPMRFLDEKTGRIVEKQPYNVLFGVDYGLATDDKIVWVDPRGTTHNLYVFGVADQAGRAAMWEVHAEERR